MSSRWWERYKSRGSEFSGAPRRGVP